MKGTKKEEIIRDHPPTTNSCSLSVTVHNQSARYCAVC